MLDGCVVTAARRQTAALVFCSALALYLLTAGGSLTSSDAVVTFELTRSLVDRHSIALPSDMAGLETNRGVDGRFYSQYGIGQSLYNVPFYVAAKALSSLSPRQVGKPDTMLKAAVALGSAVAAALAVLFVFLLSVELGAAPPAAVVAAASAAIASPLWPYSKFGFSTALTAAILVGSATLVAAAARTGTARLAAAAGAVLAFGWLTRHEIALVLVPFSAVLLMRAASRATGTRQVLALVGCAACGGALWAWYNIVRFGGPMAVGYSPSFGLAGYAAFLIAPGGSVLLFAPVVILWLGGIFRGGSRADAVLLAGTLVVFYAFYAALVDWPGGRSYGPRYLVPALVLLAPGAAWLWERARPPRLAIASALAACAVLQLPGVLVDYSKVSVDWARSATADAVQERNWHLSSSPLVLDTRAASRMLPANLEYLAGTRTAPAVARTASTDDRDFSQQFAFSLDFWWLYLIYLHAIPRTLGIAAAAGLLVISLSCAAAAWRRAHAAVRAAAGA